MKRKEKSVYLIGVVGIDLFPQRMSLEKEFGEALYKQLIAVLELVGKEVNAGNNIPHYRLGVFLDTKNPGTRMFELEEKAYDAICKNFGHGFHKRLSEYAKREQLKGTNILYQLNNGAISMQDFADRLKHKL